jgi:hypothetical protein
MAHARGTFLACLAGLGLVALASSTLVNRAQGAGDLNHEDGDRNPLAEEAGVLQLLSDYHGALAYGGNIDAMGSLWVEDSSLTLNNGTPYVGKDAVLGFFASGPYFSHNWVSLAPEWKTTITVHGHTAEATTECIATDVSVTPNVVRGVIQVNATCEKRHGKWYFTQMNNISLPEL